MMRIAVLPGDGIGPEVIAAAVSVLDAVTDSLEMVTADIGLDCCRRTGDHLPRETFDIIDDADAVLCGTVMAPENDKGYRDPLTDLKRRMELYANIRPIYRISEDIGAADADMIVIRENLEGIYSLAESEDLDGVTMERRVSIKNCKRICRIARRIGEDAGRKKITCVHKADVLRTSEGMFRDIFYEEMSGTPMQTCDEIIDRAAAGVVMDPGSFDVVVSLNLYGDIISEIASAMVGGVGITPSGNIGDDKGLFEPIHGPRPDISGTDSANPISSMLSASMMLDFLGMKEESLIIKNAVRKTVADGFRPADLGGTYGTYEFAEKVAEACQSLQGME